jgi:hypothetical protein
MLVLANEHHLANQGLEGGLVAVTQSLGSSLTITERIFYKVSGERATQPSLLQVEPIQEQQM